MSSGVQPPPMARGKCQLPALPDRLHGKTLKRGNFCARDGARAYSQRFLPGMRRVSSSGSGRWAMFAAMQPGVGRQVALKIPARRSSGQPRDGQSALEREADRQLHQTIPTP